MHEFSGTCEDMIQLTGTSCRTTCEGLSSSCQEHSSDGLLVVEGTTHLQEMTLQWTPRSPGVLLIILGGFSFYGPPNSDGWRGDALWSLRSTRNSRAVALRATALPPAGVV